MAKLKALTEAEIVNLNGTANTYALSNQRVNKYIVIHYSTSLNSNKNSARNSAAWFSNPDAEASADYIVDDEEFIQYNSTPLKRACWSVGGDKYNTNGGRLFNVCTNINSVSVEIASTNTKGYMAPPNDPSWKFTTKALNNAIRLVRYLMKVYGLDITRVIRHYDVNGKQCPGIVGWNEETGDESKWEHFLYCVKNNCSWDTKEDTTKKTVYAVQVGAFEHKDNADALCKELKNEGYEDAWVVTKEV